MRCAAANVENDKMPGMMAKHRKYLPFLLPIFLVAASCTNDNIVAAYINHSGTSYSTTEYWSQYDLWSKWCFYGAAAFFMCRLRSRSESREIWLLV